MSFHPSKSQLTENTIRAYLEAPTTDSITSGGLPIGIGPATEKKLSEERVLSGFQLIAKFLSFRGANMTPKEHVQAFYGWLCDIGTPPGHRAGLCHAVAEKANTMFPELGYSMHDY
jgi:hypothetical protein